MVRTENRVACLLMAVGFAVLTVPQATLAQEGAGKKAHHAPDKVKATRTLTGQFVGFEQGDYLHATFKKANGKTTSFFLNRPGMEYFLVLNRGAKMTVTYQVVDTYIEEAGGVQTIERLAAVRAGKQTYASWWKQTRAKYSPEQLEKKYGKRVQQATRTP